MIRFTQQITIRRPVEDVFRAYTDPGQLAAWQPGLEDVETHATVKGYDEPVTRLKYKLGRRVMIVIQSIHSVHAPTHYCVEYTLKGMHHTVTHVFEARGPSETAWTAVSEIRFSGLMRLFGRRMRAGLEEQGNILMKNFKGYLEHAR